MSTGQLSLAQGAMFGIGAYVAAFATTVFTLPLWAGLVLGCAAAALIGAALGAVLLRLSHFYFAIATLAFGELTRVFFLNFEWTVTTPQGLLGPQGQIGFQKIYYLVEHGISVSEFAIMVWTILCVLFVFFLVIVVLFRPRGIIDRELLRQIMLWLRGRHAQRRASF